jgi:beta-glucosidase-like glycosyl hydrolase
MQEARTMRPDPSGDIDAAHVDAVVAALTLEEKASLTVGRDFFNTQDVPRLDIPAVWLADGPNGLRRNATAEPALTSVPATCFPSASALGASWDPALVREVGAAIGEEAQALGVGVVLAPGLNLKRSPLCGRNFEYYSEDPLLSGRLGAAFIDGVQAQGVGACPKHFVANENERVRYVTDSIVDEQTLRELYLRPFELCVTEAAPWMVMAAFNRINGVPCAANPWLLTTVLREEWGFRGVTVSDWYGVDDRDRLPAGRPASADAPWSIRAGDRRGCPRRPARRERPRRARAGPGGAGPQGRGEARRRRDARRPATSCAGATRGRRRHGPAEERRRAAADRRGCARCRHRDHRQGAAVPGTRQRPGESVDRRDRVGRAPRRGGRPGVTDLRARLRGGRPDD